jgi:glycosyltransferase involved in cell wall biosynthesis
MILGIDATNIRSGGGLTHLKEILENGNPYSFGITKVVIWSNMETLNKLADFIWLEKITHKSLNKPVVYSFLYQMLFLSKSAKSVHNCDLLFVPGGTFLGSFKNIVSMSQNMLPFEETEYLRFKNWKIRLRFKLLHFTQSQTFKKSKGVVFLTNYAKEAIATSLKLKVGKCKIIPHGTSTAFVKEPVAQNSITNYNQNNPYKLLYVSIVTAYKHQWNVAAAVLKLKGEGYYVVLDLVGDITEESRSKLEIVLNSELNTDKTVRYLGLIPYEKLSKIYSNANGFIFASTCENMPIILIEAMTAGLPIACSNFGPMTEVLGDAGVYFDPTNVYSIYEAIKLMLNDKQLREDVSTKAFNKSINYTWKNCSDETFRYLSEVAKNK